MRSDFIMAIIHKFPVKSKNPIELEIDPEIDYDKVYEEYYAGEEKFYLEHGYYEHNAPDEGIEVTYLKKYMELSNLSKKEQLKEIIDSIQDDDGLGIILKFISDNFEVVMTEEDKKAIERGEYRFIE